MRRIWKSLYFNNRFYYLLGGIVFLMALGLFGEFFFHIARILLGVFAALTALEIIMLFSGGINKFNGSRTLQQRFSNGDNNEVKINLRNRMPFKAAIEIIDEIPAQFQKRDFLKQLTLNPGQAYGFSYFLRPVNRGEYHFGALNVFVSSPIGLVKKRFRFSQNEMVKVYPSFQEMRKFEMMAISNRLSEIGIKKIRRVGHQMEFDQIRDYTKGDDYRTINWKATARKNHLMVNQYQEEKSQQMFSLIDMGRTMKMPFGGMTLLDYAINTSLVLSNIAMLKHDKAGLITFNQQIQAMVPAKRNERHLQTIMEVLYNQETGFDEHNLQAVYTTLRRHVHHRSLIMLYSNFSSLSAAHRQMPILQKIARDHLLVIVFFENTEVTKVTHQATSDMEGIYIKTIAEKFAFDKKLIVRELDRHGIHTVLTEPGKLTVDALNKYLELKARGFI
ncbi:DUF58 domain-containing protein [Marinilabiliaceae bacterium JC017]|nr:DUF58 domain-containing protein [Marinilabiliaceae bacterium JC017]